MKGILLPGDRRVVVADFPDPEPGPGEVLVRIKASAICRSDLSLYYGNAVIQGEMAGKVITGHEPAGIIEGVGTGVKNLVAGDRVAVYLAVGCGHCRWCRQGDFQLCHRWECLGFTRDGGNAELLKVPERNCLKIPDDMSYAAAAVSTDAFGTLYSALRKVEAAGGRTVAIFGLGPMGASGILAAKALGARVIAIDPLEERRHFAEAIGADHVLAPGGDGLVADILDLTDGEGVDAAIDCSGNGNAQNAALDVTRRFGKVAFIGEAQQTMIRPSDQLIRKQISLMGSWYFRISEYDDILRIVRDKAVPLDSLITHFFELGDAERAFRMFDNRETEKAVFLM